MIALPEFQGSFEPGGFSNMNFKLLAASGAIAACAASPIVAQSAPAAQAAPAPVAAQPAPAVTPAVAAVPLTVQPQATNMLPSNSDVWVSLDNELTSKKAHVGDAVAFKVSRDVMVGQYVVIPRGTPAAGRVTYRTGKGAFGKSAKMEFDIDSVQLSSRTIPVSGHYRIEGQGNTGATVATAVAVGVFSAFVTGHSAIAAQGSEWKAATKEPITIAAAGASN
ncbi:MAG: hypothetical protein ACJ8DO_06130 [Microvirga sp.]|jgi:hypothetical protein